MFLFYVTQHCYVAALCTYTETDRERAMLFFTLLIGISSAQTPEEALGLKTQSEQRAVRRAHAALLAALLMIPLSHNKSYTWPLMDSWFTAGVRH